MAFTIDPFLGFTSVLNLLGDDKNRKALENQAIEQRRLTDATIQNLREPQIDARGNILQRGQAPKLTESTRDIISEEDLALLGKEQTAVQAGGVARDLYGEFSGLDRPAITAGAREEVRADRGAGLQQLTQSLNEGLKRANQGPEGITSNRYSEFIPQALGDIAGFETRYGQGAEKDRENLRLNQAIARSLGQVSQPANLEAARQFQVPQMSDPAQAAQVTSQLRAPDPAPSPLGRFGGDLTSAYLNEQDKIRQDKDRQMLRTALSNRFLGNSPGSISPGGSTMQLPEATI